MNREDIIKMAREAGSIDSEEVIETMFAAFSAAEREACIEAVEKSRVIEFVVYPKDYMISRNDVPRCYDFQHARTMEAIKARGNQ